MSEESTRAARGKNETYDQVSSGVLAKDWSVKSVELDLGYWTADSLPCLDTIVAEVLVVTGGASRYSRWSWVIAARGHDGRVVDYSGNEIEPAGKESKADLL